MKIITLSTPLNIDGQLCHVLRLRSVRPTDLFAAMRAGDDTELLLDFIGRLAGVPRPALDGLSLTDLPKVVSAVSEIVAQHASRIKF